MRELIIDCKTILLKELETMKVDAAAHELFLNKAVHKVIKLENLSAAQANILKQTALVCGADLAIPRHAYRGSVKKKFPAMLCANQREIEKITSRLSDQPWMKTICDDLKRTMAPALPRVLKLINKNYELNRTFIMGIINITPDSFYGGNRYLTAETIKKIAEEMENEGADFIDVGAESTRPGAQPLKESEEIARLKTALPVLSRTTKIPISVDTYKSGVASFAVEHGAQIINDISGLGFDRKMARIIARNKVGLVIMHIKGKPKTMQVDPAYENLMAELHAYFKARIEHALDSGVEKERIIVDPGLGFGKRLEDNYEIIRRLEELRAFQRPVMAGHSRKSFIGSPFELAPEQRLEGTLGVEALLIENGASILRVHDVLEAKRVAMLVDRILK